MIDFFVGQGWTVVGPYLPKGFPALRIRLIEKNNGPQRMVKTWLSLGDDYWSQAKRASMDEMKEGLSYTWGPAWRERVGDHLLNFIADELGELEEVSEREAIWWLDALDQVVGWVINRPTILTVKEAEQIWNLSGLRNRIREGRFLEEECWQSGKTWMVRVWGMYRRYGWPALYMLEQMRREEESND